MLQGSLAQARTQIYGVVATLFFPAQEEWGLNEGLMTNKTREKLFKLLDNLFLFFQTLLPVAFLGMIPSHLKLLATACHRFVSTDGGHIYTGKKSLSTP